MTEAPSTEIVQRTPQQELIAQVRTDEFKQQVAMALPENVPAHRFQRAAVTALLQNPELAECEPASVFQALVKCAMDGLMPDGKQAALVIFKDNKAGVKKAQYLAMIDGIRLIAAEHGWAIQTTVVYAGDTFEYELGLEPKLIHRPAPGNKRGDLVNAYAIATHRDGRKEIEVMTAEDIAKVRASSRTSSRGPWVDWPERMWEKTPGRRLFRKLPLDPADKDRIVRVLQASELTPAAAAVALYGPGADHALEATNDSPPTPDGAEPSAVGPGTGGESQQTGTAAEDSPLVGQAAAPVPGAPDFSDEPVAEPVQTSFVAPPPRESETEELGRAAAAAGLTIVPDGQFKGLTIQQVAVKGADGEAWLGYVLRKFDHAVAFRVAVETYCKVLAPDVWAKYETEGAP